MWYRRLIIASAVTAAGLSAIGGLALSRAPNGYRLPTHWNLVGEPDRFASAGQALFMPPVAVLAVTILLAVIPVIEPLQNRLERSAGLYRSAWIAVLALLSFGELKIAAPLLFGVTLPTSLGLVAPGLLLIVIGNALPKSRPGFFVGIRTPWTLTDENNWIATHRFGAWTTIAGGAMLILAAMLPVEPVVAMTLRIVALIVVVVPPIVYSFVFWLRHGRRTA